MRAFNHILSLLFITIFFGNSVFAQGQGAPESMNYQAVIRDGSGNVLASQAVSLRIKILQGSASGSPVYVETFAPTTNAYGSIAIQIGTGSVITGTFNTIDWGANSYFVETAVDISGGTNYTVISTTQLMSVPYALYAKNAGLDSTAIQAMIDASGSGGSFTVGTSTPFVPNWGSTTNANYWPNGQATVVYTASSDGFLTGNWNGDSPGYIYFYCDNNTNPTTLKGKMTAASYDGASSFTFLIKKGENYQFSRYAVQHSFGSSWSYYGDLENCYFTEINSSSSSSSSSGSDANTLIYTSDGF